jgi:hypothetical protein
MNEIETRKGDTVTRLSKVNHHVIKRLLRPDPPRVPNLCSGKLAKYHSPRSMRL